MILNKRTDAEEKFLRKVIVLIRLSSDKSIKSQADVSRYLHEMYKGLGFEESRDIMLAWGRLQKDPEGYIKDTLAKEMLAFFSK